MDLQGLLVLLRENPAAVQGFIGGMVAAILVHIVSWRWTIIRRRHNGGANATQERGPAKVHGRRARSKESREEDPDGDE